MGPVRNFNLFCEGLVFPTFSVRRFSEDELNDLIDKDFWSEADFYICMCDPWFFMEYEAEPGKEWDTARKEFETFLNALAFFKTASTILRIGHFYVKNLEGAGASSKFRGELVPTLTPIYVLNNDECEGFIGFYNKYTDFINREEEHNQQRRINRSIDSFTMVRKTSNLAERLIFLSISLEALFSREIDELKYRYSHRAAIMLGTDSRSRTRTFTLVKEFYNKRSQLLHGSLKFRITPNEALLYNEIIRVSILRYISLHHRGRRNIIRDLDELIFDEEGRARLLADAIEYFGVISEFKENPRAR